MFIEYTEEHRNLVSLLFNHFVEEEGLEYRTVLESLLTNAPSLDFKAPIESIYQHGEQGYIQALAYMNESLLDSPEETPTPSPEG